eukprot:9481992-Pyramimonas_sp.AAC.1
MNDGRKRGRLRGHSGVKASRVSQRVRWGVRRGGRSLYLPARGVPCLRPACAAPCGRHLLTHEPFLFAS